MQRLLLAIGRVLAIFGNWKVMLIATYSHTYGAWTGVVFGLSRHCVALLLPTRRGSRHVEYLMEREAPATNGMTR